MGLHSQEARSLHVYSVRGNLVASSPTKGRMHDIKVISHAGKEIVLSCGDSGSIFVQSLHNMEVLQCLSPPLNKNGISSLGALRTVSLSQDKQFILAGTDNGDIFVLWNKATKLF